MIAVQCGPRTAAAAAVRLGRVVELGGRRYRIGTGTMVVDDARHQRRLARGLSAPDGVAVTLLALDAPARLVGQAIDPTAEPGYGKGRYTARFTVARELPGGASGADAPLILTVTISAG